MKKNLKRWLEFALTATLLFTACESETATPATDETDYATLNEVEFWSTYSTEKVLRETTLSYDEVKGDAVVSVTAVRGEEEATQIIMTSGENPVKEYDLSVFDLKDSDGNVFSKDNVKVYHQKYINVTKAAEFYTTAGYYPDCLVPYENVKAVGETGFDANSNQGLYVSFDVPSDQSAGTYSGSLQVTIGGETKTIPTTLRVANAKISKETHTQSVFLNEWYFYRGELDETEEMYDAYNQMLFDYRLGCNNVILGERDVEYYAEKVCEYAQIPECPAYNIPHFFKVCSESNPYMLNGKPITISNAYDPDLLQLYMKTIAYKGLEKGIDPFKKAVIYGYDEPELNLGVNGAKNAIPQWSYIVRQCKNIVIEELQSDETIANKELLATILDSLDKVPHLLTQCTFLDIEYDLETMDMVYCPEFQFIQTQEVQDQYRLAEDNQLWWYGCSAPDYPYPSYHIDDTLLSARVLSWMQADYHIQGNLYWASNFYSTSVDGKEVELDYYDTGMRCSNTNGEGFLMYPGAKYGVYGPLPSVRLEQIRDGLEEYEMIYALREHYATVAKETGVPFSEASVMKYLYDLLYTGTKVGTTSANFQAQRDVLISLLELASSDANVCITDVKEGLGNYTFTVYAKDGYTLKQGDTTLTNGIAKGNGYLYTFDFALRANTPLQLSVDVDGVKYAISMSFGNSAVGYDAQYIFDNDVVQKRYVTVSTELVDAKTVNAGAENGAKYLQLHLGSAEVVAQDFLLVDDNTIAKLSKADKKFTVRLYNASDETISAELLLKYESDGKYSSYTTLTLKPGENVLEVNNIDSFNWAKIKSILEVRIIIGSKGDAPRDCLYLMDMSVYA